MATLEQLRADRDQVADRLRAKQDRLLGLIEQTNPAQLELRIASVSSAPFAKDLRQFIYPQWEMDIDHCIRVLAGYLGQT